MIKITNEDNMKLMARYKDNYFDLAIVDPPYGIGAGKMTMGSGKHEFKKGKDWDNAVPTKEYFDELFRVSKNQIIWGGNYFELPLNNNWLIWDKLNPNLSFSEAELAWCSIDKNIRIFKRLSTLPDYDGKKRHPTQKPVKLYEWQLMRYATCKTCKNDGGYYEDVAGDGGFKLWQNCDDCYNEHTETNGFQILDTHLGSGSIALACHNLGFDLTAC